MKRSKRAIRLRRRIFVVFVALFIVAGITVGIRQALAAYGRWHNSLPLLCVQDSYGKVVKIHKSYESIIVTGPAKAWSPRYGLGIWEEKWGYPKFQLTDKSVELRTQDGTYTIFLQPHGWHDVDHDLKKSRGEITIALR